MKIVKINTQKKYKNLYNKLSKLEQKIETILNLIK